MRFGLFLKKIVWTGCKWLERKGLYLDYSAASTMYRFSRKRLKAGRAA